MSHDPLCPQGPPDNPWCMCGLIGRVRADERDRIAREHARGGTE